MTITVGKIFISKKEVNSGLSLFRQDAELKKLTGLESRGEVTYEPIRQ